MMSLAKIGARHQITIPKEIVEKLALHVGDYVEVVQEGGRVILIPKEIVDRKDAWFWSKEWQTKEREADEALSKGESKDFENADELLEELRS